MKRSSHEAEGLVALSLVSAASIAPSKADTAGKEIPNKSGRGSDTGTLVGDVVLHTGLRVDGELETFVYRATKGSVVVAGIHVVGIVFGVINMFFGAVATEAVGSNFKLLGSETEGHETEDAEEKSDGFGRYCLDGTDVDGLGVIPEPVSKVNSGDVELVELLAAKGSCHGNLQQSILDVSMAP